MKTKENKKTFKTWKAKFIAFVTATAAYLAAFGYVAIYAENHAIKAFIKGITIAKVFPYATILYVAVLLVMITVIEIVAHKKRKK